MNALPVDNLYADVIFNATKVDDGASLFYKSNGSKKTLSEFMQNVQGQFDPMFCPNHETALQRQDLRSFLGYSPENLSVDMSLWIAGWQGGIETFKVTGVNDFSVSCNNVLATVTKYDTYFNISWNKNTSTSFQYGLVSVTGGGKTETIEIRQKPRPLISGLPTSTLISGEYNQGAFKEINFSCNYNISNISSCWQSGEEGFNYYIYEKDGQKVLRISFLPRSLDPEGKQQLVGDDILTLSCLGVVYTISCSGFLIVDDPHGGTTLDPIDGRI